MTFTIEYFTTYIHSLIASFTLILQTCTFFLIKPVQCKSGVSQGSVLGPLFFVQNKQPKLKTSNTHVVISKSVVQCSHIEVQPLVHKGPSLSLLRVQARVFGILVDQVGADGTRLPQAETIVVQGGDGVLGVDLENKIIHYRLHSNLFYWYKDS